MRDERTTNEQLKIELLSQWKLEAESRNEVRNDDDRSDSCVAVWADAMVREDFLYHSSTIYKGKNCHQIKCELIKILG